MRQKLSVVIAARNEERILADSLASVGWADEIVVVDDVSTDRTAEIARAAGAVVIVNQSAGNFHVNKNLGLEMATGDWILSLDADEIVDEELARAIRESLSGDTMLGYRVRRKNYCLGRWIRGCGWYPNLVIRLFRKGATQWPLDIHDTPSISDSSRVGRLPGHLIHYSYVSTEQYMAKLCQYSKKVGEEHYARGVRVTPLNCGWLFVVQPAYWFLKTYFLLCGFRDGFRGLYISGATAAGIFFWNARIWELQQGSSLIRPDRTRIQP